MYLKNQSGFEFFFFDTFCHIHHGYLDYIGCRTLNSGIHCRSFAKFSDHKFRIFNFWNVASSVKYGLYIAIFDAEFNLGIQVSLYIWIGYKIVIYKFFGFLETKTCLIGKTKIRNAIDNSEVYSLGLSADIWGDIFFVQMEYIHSCLCMNINIRIKCFN